MAEKFINKGMVNGNLVVRGMAINIYADRTGNIEAPSSSDIIINKGMINGNVVFQNPSVNIYLDNVKQKAEVIEGEFYDLDEPVTLALTE